MLPEEHFRIQLRFWGVRGSIPVPQSATLSYGGNTACIEVRLPGDRILIIDGGTGVRNLGTSLEEELKTKQLTIQFFLTHFHWDHIQGLPFFAPLYDGRNEVTFLSSLPPAELGEILEGQMSYPYFPVRFDMLAAKRTFVKIEPETSRFGPLSIYPFPLNHPQGATGCRLETDGAVIVHACDFEHGNAKLDGVLRDYAQNADILIYDAQYTPEEYETRKGWGHSTWVQAARMAQDANVKQLILFHHDPSHQDAAIDEIVAETRRCFKNTEAAREGWSVTL